MRTFRLEGGPARGGAAAARGTRQVIPGILQNAGRKATHAVAKRGSTGRTRQPRATAASAGERRVTAGLSRSSARRERITTGAFFSTGRGPDRRRTRTRLIVQPAA